MVNLESNLTTVILTLATIGVVVLVLSGLATVCDWLDKHHPRD